MLPSTQRQTTLLQKQVLEEGPVTLPKNHQVLDGASQPRLVSTHEKLSRPHVLDRPVPPQ